MIEQIKSVWARHDLFISIVQFQLKAENKNKALGFLWSLLDPLLLMLTYIILVHYIFGRGGPQFPVLLFSALLSWRWFASSLGRSVTSITSKVKLVQTVRFPLAILPLSGIAVGFFDWLFGFIILIPMFFLFQANLSIHMLWLPVLLLIQLIFTIGACLICAVLGTYLSDLSNVIQFLIRIWFYLSPILYSVQDRIPEKYLTIYMFANPFAGLMESYKNILILGQPPNQYVLLTAIIGVLVFWFGIWYFNRDERKLVKAI